MSDSDEDWDSELGLEGSTPVSLSSHLANRPTTAITNNNNNSSSSANNSASNSAAENHQHTLKTSDDIDEDSDDDSDWDSDFVAPQKILGIRADPNAKEEDWDADFEFTDASEVEEKSVLSPTRNPLLTRTTRPAGYAGAERAVSCMQDLLPNIPTPSATPPAGDTKDKQDEDEDDELDWGSDDESDSAKPSTSSENPSIKEVEAAIAEAKAKGDKAAESRAHFGLGQIYRSTNKLVNALSSFQMALRVVASDIPSSLDKSAELDKGGLGIIEEAPEDDGPRTSEADVGYELELLYQLGTTAKAMSDIFQQTAFLDRALELLQRYASRVYLDNGMAGKFVLERYVPPKSLQDAYVRVNYELGLCHITTENPILALKHFETYLRCLTCANCTASCGPSASFRPITENDVPPSPRNSGSSVHVHTSDCATNETEVDWKNVALGCIQVGKLLKTLDQPGLALSYVDKAIASAHHVRDHDTVRAASLLKTQLTLAMASASGSGGSGSSSGSSFGSAGGSTLTLGSLSLGSTGSAGGSGISLGSDKSKHTRLAAPAGKGKSSGSNLSMSSKADTDDDEDWDAELGISSETDERSPLQLHGQVAPLAGRLPVPGASMASAPKADRVHVPPRYRILDTVSNQAFEILKFPKPSFLYSLTTGDGHVFMHEEALEKWLSSIVVKHAPARPAGDTSAWYLVPPSSPSAADEASLMELRNTFSHNIEVLRPMTRPWARAYLDFCHVLFRGNYTEPCLEKIVEFFGFLKNTAQTSPVPHEEREGVLVYGLQILYLAAKMWKPEDDSAYWTSVVQTLRQFEPRHADLVELTVAETYAHHLHLQVHRASSPDDEEDDDEEDTSDSDSKSSIEDGEGAADAPAAEGRDNEEQKDNPLATFVRVFTRAKPAALAAIKSGNIDPAQNRPSTPTFNAKSPPAAREEMVKASEVNPVAAYARALIDMHMFSSGISPLTSTRLSPPADVGWGRLPSDLDKSTLKVNLEMVSVRMQLLQDVYGAIPISYLKARAAYALAHHATSQDNYVLAEKLLFECVYILDHVASYTVNHPMVSELGFLALIGFGEVLLNNYKYQYAILCFEAALANLQLRRRTKEYFTLLRRVATIARENDDVKRSILFYREILAKYALEHKINEVIYISETLSSLVLERGDIHLAEGYLVGASISFGLGKPGAGAGPDTRMDPLYFGMQQRLAGMYLDSYGLERGVELLESLFKVAGLPNGKRNGVLVTLAKAYTRRQWYDESFSLLQRFEKEEGPPSRGQSARPTPRMSGGVAPPPPPVLPPFPVLSTASAGNLGPSQPVSAGTGSRPLSFFELAAVTYFRSGRYREAFACVDRAIEICPSSSLSARGYFFYLRGKILQALASCASPGSSAVPAPAPSAPLQTSSSSSSSSSSSPSTTTPSPYLTFPTTLRPNEEWRDHLPFSMGDTYLREPSVYTCSGDIVQECIASFRKAYQYFKNIGDDVRIGKAVARIAETYLDRVFSPVILMHYPYEDLARLPPFTLSSIVSSASKDEKTAEPKQKRGGTLNKKPVPAPTPKAADEPKEFLITLEAIENPAKLALDLATDTCNVMAIIRLLLNMAELRMLQGDKDGGLGYWTESKNQLFSLFFDGPALIAPAPAHIVAKLARILKRMARFLLCLDSDIINRNLMVLDAYLLIELDLETALKRPVPPRQSRSSRLSTSGSSMAPAGTQVMFDSNIRRHIVDVFNFSPSVSRTLTVQSGRRNNSTTQGSPNGSSSSSQVNVGASMSLSPSVGSHRKGRLARSPSISGNINGSTRSNRTTSLSTGVVNSDEAVGKDMIAERVWGYLYSIKLQIRKYGAGRVSLEELQARNQYTLKKTLKLLATIRASPPGADGNRGGSATNFSFGTPMMRSPSVTSTHLGISSFQPSTPPVNNNNHSQTSPWAGTATPSATQPSRPSPSSYYDNISFTPPPLPTPSLLPTPSIPAPPDLSRLLYALQLDSHVFYYLPSSGKRQITRLGIAGQDSDYSPHPPSHIYLEVRLIAHADQCVTLLVPASTSLEKILAFLVTKRYWAAEKDTRNRKGFFGTFSKAQMPPSNTMRFLSRSQDFHTEFAKLLSILGVTPVSDDAGHEEPMISPVTSPLTQSPPLAIKSAFFAKKVTRGVSDRPLARPYQQLSEQMGYPVHRVFSNREMVESSEQTPLTLFLYLSSNTEENSTFFGRASGNDHSIVLSHDALHDIMSTLSLKDKELPDSLDDKKKTLADIANSFAINDILHGSDLVSPLTSPIPPRSSDNKSSPSSNPPPLLTGTPGAKPRSSFFPTRKPEPAPARMVTTRPVLLICTRTFQALPWELIVGDLVVRYMTLYDLVSPSADAPSIPSASKSEPSTPTSVSPPAGDTWITPRKTSAKSTKADLKKSATFSAGLPYEPEHLPDGSHYIPILICCYHSAAEKLYIGGFDEKRREWLLKSLPYMFQGTDLLPSRPPSVSVLPGHPLAGVDDTSPWVTAVGGSGSNSTLDMHSYASLPPPCTLPYQTPLVKYGKKPIKRDYKFIDFFDLSNPHTNLAAHFNSFAATDFPVLLLTFCDLMDMSQSVVDLLRSKRCTALFVAGSHLKTFAAALMKYIDVVYKTRVLGEPLSGRSGSFGASMVVTGDPSGGLHKDRYQIIMSAVRRVQEDRLIPVAVFNPPRS